MNLPRLFLRLLGRRLPQTAGTVSVPGLSASLTIRRDGWGVPYIDAATETDAWFGLGYCHGQDRAFQLEMLQRVLRGTLAEWVGPETLPVDRLSRRIGFHRSACAQVAALAPDMRAMVAAYVRGINASQQALPARPHEFVLLGGQPAPWAVEDVLGVVKIVSFRLASNWDVELARLQILLEDGAEALTALDPAYPADHPVVAPPGQPAGQAVDRLREELAQFADLVRVGGGSNNWALAASRTATGRPLLANDPHLDPGLPGHWYLAHLRTPDWTAAGASFVGGPGLLTGHNEVAAWGLTFGMIDNSDLFQEEVGPDGRSVRQGRGWVPCSVVLERIPVKGQEAVVERVLVTPRGPIITPLESAGERTLHLSLRATWLDPLPIHGLLGLHRVRGFDAFRAATAEWPGASQNMVYADVHGTIGWQLMGRAPRRRQGLGLVPLPGWSPEVGWEVDPLPFDQIPYTRDPECGFLATANACPVPQGTGPWLGADWVDGYRVWAIQRALGSRSDWDVAAALRLQTDKTSLAWADMRAWVLGVPPRTSEAAQALELLANWNGIVDEGSSAATIFELFVAEMSVRVARARAPRSYQWALGKSPALLSPYNNFGLRRIVHLLRLLREQPKGWFERGWPDECADVLTEVVRRLRAEHGADPGRWAWGRLRPLTMVHPLSRDRRLARVFDLGPVPQGGDTWTISQASVLPLAPLARAENVATMRAVYDVGAWSNSRYVLAGGQSGNPFSPHYADQWPLWQRGEAFALAWTPEEVRRATRATLTLLPQ